MQNQLNSRPFEYFEEYYKQGLVSTASIQRVVLALYERILLLLKRALACEQDITAMRRNVAQAQQIMTHLLGLFLDHQSLKPLYVSHERIAQLLTDIFRQRRYQPQLLNEGISRIEAYQTALRQQLQIKAHFPDEGAARLNVRRSPQS
ncbi:MAG: hypothetical protein ACAI44_08145 [Candidatus Sericytochromatia bacterium]